MRCILSVCSIASFPRQTDTGLGTRRSKGAGVNATLLYVTLATVPALLLAAVTWRVVWPRWKLWAKLIAHPCVYLLLALTIGYWSVPIAWLHQGAGLAGHIWFSKKHGFTWYAVEEPERYVAASRAMVDALRPRRDD